MLFISTALFLFSLMGFACDDGIVPQNDRHIPVNASFANDMTEAEFKSSLKEFAKFFSHYVDRTADAELIVMGSWMSSTVNAFAERESRKVRITVYGGLARHPAITRDGLTLTLCHELGHHFGGYPKKQTNTWSSAEGQADYYASMKCLRRIWEREDNAAALKNIVVPEKVRSECALSYKDSSEQVLCQRMAMAGKSLALMIQDLDHDSIEPKFETPDDLVVRATNYMHPFAQCRLDTIFNGALCPVLQSVEFDDYEPTKGSCHERFGDKRGLRPRCWFLPRY